MRHLKLFLPPLVVLFAAPSAFACLCSGTTVQKSFKEATAIFTGTFLRSEYRKGIKSWFEEQDMEWKGKKVDYEVLVYIFETDQWWKGAGTKEIMLITDQTRRSDGTESVSDCGLGFEPDIKYLVYAFGEGDNFKTGFCTLTKHAEKAAKDFSILNKLAKPVAAR